MTKQEEASKVQSSTASPALLDDIKKKIEWDTSSIPAVKETATALAEYLTSNETEIKLPSDIDANKLRKAIGPIILENKDESMEDIMHLIVSKYGLKREEAKKSDMQDEAIASICKVRFVFIFLSKRFKHHISKSIC